MLLVLALSYFTGQNPADLVQGLDPGRRRASQPGPPATDESSRFMRVVLADTEETWDAIFKDMGQRYESAETRDLRRRHGVCVWCSGNRRWGRSIVPAIKTSIWT